MSAAQSVAPEVLAELLGIEVRAGDELIPRERFNELERIQPGAFSAGTFRPLADRVVVVYNPLSAKSHRRSDLGHELAHILLDHELGQIAKLGDVTFLSCDATQEEEAAWLSGCLLLPRALLLAEVHRGASAEDIARKCGVSEGMARYRLNVTGVFRQNQALLRKSDS
ncbi:MAG: ImmA/IrrE family metallo-endopeptidase [Truepera sp.]|nr:ImmA/IrrE family metallo-endopeptidase [Truepera sp.]